jgi:hypothetical protein
MMNGSFYGALATGVALLHHGLSGLVALFLAAGALYDRLGLDRAQPVVAAAALVAIVGFVGSSVPYWNRVLAYARPWRPPAPPPKAP